MITTLSSRRGGKRRLEMGNLAFSYLRKKGKEIDSSRSDSLSYSFFYLSLGEGEGKKKGGFQNSAQSIYLFTFSPNAAEKKEKKRGIYHRLKSL